jgi:hypothetical protein
MVSQWQVDGLMLYAQTSASCALTGAQSYTVGSGGDFDATRPSEIVGAFWRSGGFDYPLKTLTSFSEYQLISDKSASGEPEAVCYDPDYTLGTLYVWPAGTTGEIHLTLRSPLPSYTVTTEDLTLPGEYELVVRYSLAELLSALWQLPLRSDIAALAKRARKILKRNNVRISPLSMPSALLKRHSNIYRG